MYIYLLHVWGTVFLENPSIWASTCFVDDAVGRTVPIRLSDSAWSTCLCLSVAARHRSTMIWAMMNVPRFTMDYDMNMIVQCHRLTMDLGSGCLFAPDPLISSISMGFSATKQRSW